MLFSLFVSSLSAQENDTLYSPEQLKEDADFFFNTLYERHPNPYYYCGMEDFEQKKHQIYEQLKIPMTKDEFMEVMCTISPCLDNHMAAPFELVESYVRKGFRISEKSGEHVFPLRVFYNHEALYANIDGNEVQILAINDVSTRKIINTVTEMLTNQTLNMKGLAIENTLHVVLSSLFDVHPPFTVEYVSEGQILKKKLEGIPMPTYIPHIHVYERPHQIYYKIYPQSSIAILYILSFRKETMEEENFQWIMESLSDSLKLMDIQNLFIDVSKNSGGQYTSTYQVFDYLQHDTIFMSSSKIAKKSSVNVYTPYQKELIRLPQRDKRFFDKNLFVLQGARTFSCGDIFCRIIAQNKLGKLIGTSTSTYTKDFGNVVHLELPNTKIPLSCPTVFWDFSADFKTKTLDPDIYFPDVDYTNEFSEEELLKLIEKKN